MQTTQFFSVIIILLAMIFTCDSLHSTRLCKNRACNDQCDDCVWGSVYVEDCGFEECKKGPGQRCGGHRGQCGEGLECWCDRCHGCSSTSIGKDCFTEPCLPIPHRNYEWLTDNRGYVTV